MPSAANPRRMSGEDRRELIALAAGRLFAARGYEGTRMDEVASAAHVTKPMVYRHFDSKKDLYLALLDRHERDLPTFFAGLDAEAAGRSDDALVRAILDVWLDYVRANSHAWGMLFRDSSGDDEIKAARVRVSVTARAVIASFVAERAGARVPPEEVAPTAELLTSGLAGLALWWIDRPEVPKPVVLDVAARVSAAALG